MNIQEVESESKVLKKHNYERLNIVEFEADEMRKKNPDSKCHMEKKFSKCIDST